MKIIAATWRLLNHKGFFILFLVLLGGLYGTKSDRYYGWTNTAVRKGEPIIADGAGYYCHLPQWFIYKTNNFQFLDSIAKKYPKSRFTNNVYVPGDGKPPSNKYFTGSAVAMTPFFAIGHWWATSIGVDADGYSWPYLVMVNMACIFYVLLGFLGIYFFLRKFGIDRFWIIVSSLTIALGTNLGYYIYQLSPYSHIFSFAVIAWLLFAAKCWADRHSAKNFLFLCALIGFAIIIRPTSVLALVFIPFLFASTADFLSRLKALVTQQRLQLLAGLAVFGVFIYFQLWNVHLQTGVWALNTYTNETFEFLWSPKIVEVLFSWRKGLFVFAPVLFLMLPGWFVLFRRNRRLFWGSVLSFVLFTWITASWWCWWYGGGLGMRPYIDVYALLVIPIAFLFQYSRIWMQGILLVVAFVGCQVAQVYEFQMKYNIIHYDDMSYEQFWRVFMRKEMRYQWSVHLYYEHLPEEQPLKERTLHFRRKGKPMQPGVFYKVEEWNYDDNPVVTIIPQPGDSCYLFGARVKAEIYLYGEEINPSFHLGFYRDGKMYDERRFFVGQFVPEIKELHPVTIDFFPDEMYCQFDSLRIDFEESRPCSGIRNARVTQYVYRQR